jgi:hypothetical protein
MDWFAWSASLWGQVCFASHCFTRFFKRHTMVCIMFVFDILSGRVCSSSLLSTMHIIAPWCHTGGSDCLRVSFHTMFMSPLMVKRLKLVKHIFVYDFNERPMDLSSKANKTVYFPKCLPNVYYGLKIITLISIYYIFISTFNNQNYKNNYISFCFIKS